MTPPRYETVHIAAGDRWQVMDLQTGQVVINPHNGKPFSWANTELGKRLATEKAFALEPQKAEVRCDLGDPLAKTLERLRLAGRVFKLIPAYSVRERTGQDGATVEDIFVDRSAKMIVVHAQFGDELAQIVRTASGQSQKLQLEGAPDAP